jgi:hypothetical protein
MAYQHTFTGHGCNKKNNEESKSVCGCLADTGRMQEPMLHIYISIAIPWILPQCDRSATCGGKITRPITLTLGGRDQRRVSCHEFRAHEEFPPRVQPGPPASGNGSLTSPSQTDSAGRRNATQSSGAMHINRAICRDLNAV